MMKTWWMMWGDFVQKIVALVASFASMGGLLIAFLPKPADMPFWAVLALVLAVVSFVLLVVLEYHSHRGLRVYAIGDLDGIREYMRNWIEHGGVVAVWTRDMTWAQNPATRELLKAKASRNELILCLPEMSEIANELEAAGAEVCAYGSKLLPSPASRFTIAFFGKSGARVAVGRPDGDIHVIEEFGDGDHPAFALAEDLVAFARATRKARSRK